MPISFIGNHQSLLETSVARDWFSVLPIDASFSLPAFCGNLLSRKISGIGSGGIEVSTIESKIMQARSTYTHISWVKLSNTYTMYSVHCNIFDMR